MKKYYVDTAVIIDYYENRRDSLRPLGEFACQFFQFCRAENNILLYSRLTVKELAAKYSREKARNIIRLISEFCSLKEVEIKKSQANEADSLYKKRKVPFAYALHAVLARDNGAVLVTTDRHFELLGDICKSIRPEDAVTA